MDEKLKRYLDSVFSPYEDMKAIKDLKEELFYDLKEKLNDLKNEGYDEELAYHKTIDSLGDITEIVESINAKTRELQQMVGMDFSKSNLENSDFKSVKLPDGKFNYSNLQGSDFRDSQIYLMPLLNVVILIKLNLMEQTLRGQKLQSRI